MKKIVALIGALLVLPAVASADSFSATFTGTGLGAGVTAYSGDKKFNVFAGQLKWDAEGGFEDFVSYCLQIDSWLTTEQMFETSLGDHVSAEEAAKISLLVNSFWNVTTNWMAAGLQLAIWNVLYDTDDSASTGSFYSSTTQATYWADQFLSGISGVTSPSGGARFLNSLPGSNGQDQVTKVPEPGTLLLLGAGAVALAVRRRMRRAA